MKLAKEAIDGRAETRDRVRRFVIDTFRYGDATGLTDDQSLIQSGVVDSTGVLELVTWIEETFEVRVADREVVPDNLDSVDKVAAFVGRKLAAAG